MGFAAAVTAVVAVVLVIALVVVPALRGPATPAGAGTSSGANPKATGSASAGPAAGRANAGTALDTHRPGTFAVASRPGGTELYGYLPYWQMSTSMADYLGSVSLTSLELFSVSAIRNGTINRGQLGYKRITGAIGARLIADAHARGQRVELVFTSFGFDRNAALFGVTTLPSFDPTVRRPLESVDPAGTGTEIARTVRGLVSLVARLGLDGVNVDAEQVSPGTYAGFSAFISQLRHGLDGVDPALRLSAATMASHAGANLAGVALDAGADRVFLMGYDFHWSGSDPGGSTPVDRLDGGANLLSAMAVYADAGIPASRIILGLPLYGMAWPVASADRYAPRIGPGTAWLPSKHAGQLTAPGFLPHQDPLEVSEYFSEAVPVSATDPLAGTTYRSIFYDSPRTLRAKLAIARAAGYAGGGFWALGYERGVPGYTDLMADFVAGRVLPATPAGSDPTGPSNPGAPGSARRPAPCVDRC